MDRLAYDVVTLAHDERVLRRRRLVTAHGEGVLVDLPRTVRLAQGDALELEDGLLLAVIAAEERLMEVRGDLARLAWHIGNRHAPCEIAADALLVPADPVMRLMLEGLGAELQKRCAGVAADPTRSAMTTVFQAATDQEADDVRGLMHAFSAQRRDPLSGSSAPDDFASRDQDLNDEIAGLPERYAPPQGRLLIAYEADMLAGYAALRDRGDGDCEVERILVRGVFRGQRVGQALLERLLLEAQGAGYSRIRLHARADEEDAQHLCERAGFQRISPSPDALDEVPSSRVSFARDLRQTA